MITKGFHPWDLINLGNGMVRQCPKCDSFEIKDDMCECGYTPEPFDTLDAVHTVTWESLPEKYRPDWYKKRF